MQTAVGMFQADVFNLQNMMPGEKSGILMEERLKWTKSIKACKQVCWWSFHRKINALVADGLVITLRELNLFAYEPNWL